MPTVQKHRWLRKQCPHSETIAVGTAGLERVVCQTCGYIRVRDLDDMSRRTWTDGFDSVFSAAKAGEAWAWAAIYREIAGPVTGFLRVRGATDPEEIMGDIFFELTRSVERFEGDESAFNELVFGIARRHLLNERRDSGHNSRSQLADEVLDRLRGEVGFEGDPSGLADEIRRTLQILTSEQSEILTLRGVAGLTLEETAAVVGEAISAVQIMQRRAIAKIGGTSGPVEVAL
jgi:RNA polymerase sigma-70 factor, ECF subfamily